VPHWNAESRPLGKAVVITGAASGIGAALASAFAQSGAKLALADLDVESLHDLDRRLVADGAEVLTARLDVAQPSQVAAFAAEVQGRWRHVDIIINNAGVAVVAPALSGPIEDAHWLMNINFWGVVHCCRAFVPLMRERTDATIVNIASMFALVSMPTQAMYCASKAAVRGYSDALREELRDDGIHVLCVLPGMVKTDLLQRARLGDISMVASDRQSLRDSFESAAMTTPEQVARAIMNAVVAKRTRLLIGRDAKMADWLSRLIPGRASAWVTAELRDHVAEWTASKR
jgi:short-subunit dehydrogenase